MSIPARVAARYAYYLVLIVPFASYCDGLDEAEGLDGLGEFAHGFIVKAHAGLIGVGLYHVHGDAEDIGGVLGFVAGGDYLFIYIADGFAEFAQVFAAEEGAQALS